MCTSTFTCQPVNERLSARRFPVQVAELQAAAAAAERSHRAQLDAVLQDAAAHEAAAVSAAVAVTAAHLTRGTGLIQFATLALIAYIK